MGYGLGAWEREWGILRLSPGFSSAYPNHIGPGSKEPQTLPTLWVTIHLPLDLPSRTLLSAS